MTTQHPAGDGDTRPTDRERLTEEERVQVLDAGRDTFACRNPACGSMGGGDVLTAAVEAVLAARAPAPPDAALAQAQALRHALDEMRAVIADGDTAEVAASTPGEVGRSTAVARRDALYNDPTDWLSDYIDRLAAPEPDAATRTAPVEVYVREPGPDVTEIESLHIGGTITRSSKGLWSGIAWRRAKWDWGPLVPVGTRDRLRAAADPGTRGEGDDR